jgi:AcrR family transcriptional regulator
VPKEKSPAVARRAAPQKRRTTTVKRKRRTAEDILNRIVQAAGEEFKRNGYAGTTTATIARKADVTEAQLFRYFGSKSNLFRDTIFKPIDQHFLNFTNRESAESGKVAGSRELTARYTSELQHFIRENSRMLTSLVVAQTYDSGTAHGVGGIDSLETFFSHTASTMSKRLKKKPKVDPRLLVRLTFVSVLASVMFRDWIFPPGLASDEEIEAAINEFVMEGISVNSGDD